MLSLDENVWAFQLSKTVSAIVVAALGAAVYKSARMRTSSSLRDSKQLLRAAIMAFASLAATHSHIAAANLLEFANPAPFNASLLAAEAVSMHVDSILGLIN